MDLAASIPVGDRGSDSEAYARLRRETGLSQSLSRSAPWRSIGRDGKVGAQRFENIGFNPRR